MRRLLPLVLFIVLWVPLAAAWTWPVDGPVVQGFAFDPAHPYTGGQHRGIDIAASAGGVPVLAPTAGTVTYAGTIGANGKTVTIQTTDGLAVTLTHLGDLAVARDDVVAEGQAIGTVGPSGTPEIDGPYVHLGIRLASDSNAYLDPVSLLPVVPSPASGDGATGDQSSDGSPPAQDPAPPADTTPAETTPADTTPAETTPAETTPTETTPVETTPVETTPSDTTAAGAAPTGAATAGGAPTVETAPVSDSAPAQPEPAPQPRPLPQPQPVPAATAPGPAAEPAADAPALDGASRPEPAPEAPPFPADTPPPFAASTVPAPRPGLQVIGRSGRPAPLTSTLLAPTHVRRPLGAPRAAPRAASASVPDLALQPVLRRPLPATASRAPSTADARHGDGVAALVLVCVALAGAAVAAALVRRLLRRPRHAPVGDGVVVPLRAATGGEEGDRDRLAA